MFIQQNLVLKTATPEIKDKKENKVDTIELMVLSNNKPKGTSSNINSNLNEKTDFEEETGRQKFKEDENFLNNTNVMNAFLINNINNNVQDNKYENFEDAVLSPGKKHKE